MPVFGDIVRGRVGQAESLADPYESIKKWCD